MKIFFIFIFLFISFILYSIDYQDITNINLLPVEVLLKSVKNKINYDVNKDALSTLAPTFSNSSDLKFLDYEIGSDKIKNNVGCNFNISFSVNLSNFIINNKKKKDILFNTASFQIMSLYSQIIKKVYESQRLIKEISFYKDYKKSIFDFEKQVTIDEKIYKNEMDLIQLYQEVIILQLQVYSYSNIPFNYDDSKTVYDLVSITNIFNGTYKKVCEVQK